MSPTPITLICSATLAIAASFAASETARIGGPGGNRTVTMDCGSSAFIVGATARGGKDMSFGWNVVRRLKFTCRALNGTSTTQTTEAIADKAATVDVSNGSGTCSADRVATSLEFKTGLVIDRFHTVKCHTVSFAQQYLDMNVGGEGGSRAFLSCPNGEALYKVEARVSDNIDNLKGWCRTFVSPSNLSVPNQIESSISPKPSIANPISVPVRSSRTFSFTVLDYQQLGARALIGVVGATDLLGGAALNLPDIKVELINPSGTVVSSRTINDVKAAVISGVTFTFNANGTWKLRVTNLKQDIGTFVITNVTAALP
jgi:hypothetical protein